MFLARRMRKPLLIQARQMLQQRLRTPAAHLQATPFSSGPSSYTYVSKYAQLHDPEEIGDFLKSKGLSHSKSATHYRIRECPFCHDIKGKKDNMYKLHVEKTQGVYFCHRCGAKGSWFDFKNQMHAHEHGTGPAVESMHSSFNANHQEHHIQQVQALDGTKANSLSYNLMQDPEYKYILDYLTGKEKGQRGLSKEVLDKYGVGCMTLPHSSEDYITFPWMARKRDLEAIGAEIHESESDGKNKDGNIFDVIRLKARCFGDKSKQLLLPKGGCWGLFGWNTIPGNAESLVLTEGEYDAMAVHEATGLPAISLPNGCRSLPPAVLPLLERFSTIYLWLDDDVAGQESVAKFAQKLGLKRCLVVRPQGDELLEGITDANPQPPKDANEALLRGWDLRMMVDRADLLPHREIATFEEMRHEILQEIANPLQAAGVQSRKFPSLNEMLKGHRRGELTVLTGPTGCGKTTLLSQLSIDYCQQGVNTLWGSFEIKNSRLIKKMLSQMAGTDLTKLPQEEVEDIADKFQVLPMYFMRFFGSTDVDQVIDAMEHAAYAYDVEHVILDNVQFMMSGQGRGFDKFERQDAALDKFRKFASHNNVHVTLVIHPRKEQEDVDLTLSSVFGTAKATQEADNVLILQRNRRDVKLDIRKNRFDGTLGSIPLGFDGTSCNLFEKVDSGMMNDSLAAMDAEIEAEQAMRAEAQRTRRSLNPPTEDLPDDHPAIYEMEQYQQGDQVLHLEQVPESEISQRVEPFSTFNDIIHR